MDHPQLICLFLGPPGETSQRVLRILNKLPMLFKGLGEFELTTLETGALYGELVSSVSESIYRSVEKADLIIADITDAHPNVMYELGFAHALRKRVLPLVQKGAGQIPSDLSGYLYFTYDPEEPGKLLNVVGEWIYRNRKSKGEA